MTRPRKISGTTEAEYQRYFHSHVKEDDSGCHLWQAGKNNIGYGLFRYHDKMQSSHRVAMKIEGHNIDGKIVYHTCDNYHCVNPAHLKIGNYYDKAAVTVSKGRAGTHWRDPAYHKTCPHCGYVGSPAVIGHCHGDKCKHKP